MMPEWTEIEIQRLVDDRATESLQMEFKACGALSRNPEGKAEVGKDVSAMANAAGGVIIYGVVEKNRVADAVDHGFDPKIYSREWLEQVIDANVQPRIEGLEIVVVPLTSKGTVAYVVNVPQAISRAPHQAVDGRYYKRANFINQTMEDYEVRDAFRRMSIAKLIFDPPLLKPEGSTGNTFHYYLCFWLRNVSTITAKFPFVHVDKIEGGRISRYGVNGNGYFPLTRSNGGNSMSGDANTVIHPGQAVEVFRLIYNVQRPSSDISWVENPSWPGDFDAKENARLDLVVQIACENSPLTKQEIRLSNADLLDLLETR